MKQFHCKKVLNVERLPDKDSFIATILGTTIDSNNKGREEKIEVFFTDEDLCEIKGGRESAVIVKMSDDEEAPLRASLKRDMDYFEGRICSGLGIPYPIVKSRPILFTFAIAKGDQYIEPTICVRPSDVIGQFDELSTVGVMIKGLLGAGASTVIGLQVCEDTVTVADFDKMLAITKSSCPVEVIFCIHNDLAVEIPERFKRYDLRETSHSRMITLMEVSNETETDYCR